MYKLHIERKYNVTVKLEGSNNIWAHLLDAPDARVFRTLFVPRQLKHRNWPTMLASKENSIGARSKGAY